MYSVSQKNPPPQGYLNFFIFSQKVNFDELMPYSVRLPSSHNMRKMSTIGQNAHVQTFA